MHPDFPLPDIGWEPARPFWEAAARHELAIPRCDSCDRLVWYPKPECPYCRGGSSTWTAMSGAGRLFSWSVVRQPFLAQFAELVPYVPALVALDEDPRVRVVTRMVDCDPEDLRIDQPVRVVFGELSFPAIDKRMPAPFFTPA
jgi:uncharacterized OB-fold protein